jgi:small GTP-binding protein
MTTEERQMYRVALIGQAEVGKSSVSSRFLFDRFHKEYTSTIEDTYSIETKIDGVITELEVLDTSGRPEYRSVTEYRLSEVQGFALIYDVTNLSSFKEIQSQLEYISSCNKQKGFVAILVGNKIDKEEERVVQREDAERLATDLKLSYIECSALTGERVDEVFDLLIRDLRKQEFRRQAST